MDDSARLVELEELLDKAEDPREFLELCKERDAILAKQQEEKQSWHKQHQ